MNEKRQEFFAAKLAVLVAPLRIKYDYRFGRKINYQSCNDFSSVGFRNEREENCCEK